MSASDQTQSGAGSAAGTHHPAIEGLRAIAVLSVVLAHSLTPRILRGFIGVDIFFVISGFLICRMLFDELERDGQIHLLNFWSRRMRRLLPNATLTLIAVLLVGLLLVPGYLRTDVAMDVATSALQVSNYHFAGKAVDYFRQDDSQSPVLHFWSLAVEEQFYIVWPGLLALLCLVFRHKALPVSRILLIIICIASLAGMLKAITASQPVAFFHSWARAWQLGLGGLLAVAFKTWSDAKALQVSYAPQFRLFLGVLGWVGLGAIVASIIVLDEDTLYPGLHALPPTLGAGAIVAAVTMPPPEVITGGQNLFYRSPLSDGSAHDPTAGIYGIGRY
ncbi:MAG: acyltransferase [Rhodopseudomonas palustris]|nr:acyltransferase [Rhodopseudomonas palustris]